VAQYARIFVVADIADVHRAFDRDMRLAERIIQVEKAARLPPTAAATLLLLERAYVDFNRRLNELARTTAGQATASIKQRIQATRALNRGDTGRGTHLRNAVRSRPLRPAGRLATGAVGVGDLAVLDALVNPVGGYGPYWRAQEYGTGTAEVPAQKGRVIRGYFFGRGFGGTPERPQQQFRGLGVGPHPIFVSASAGAAAFGALGFGGGHGTGGGRGGYGTISVELPGRHFIRDGANAAERNWRQALRAIEFQTLRDLRAITRVP
jgi:hypothetical protein